MRRFLRRLFRRPEPDTGPPWRYSYGTIKITGSTGEPEDYTGHFRWCHPEELES
jgi:hypothetical protein